MDALPVILRKDSIELLTKYRVYTERELQSRYAILCENYVKTVNIEGRLMSMIARTMILPAALRYQGEVASAVNATKAAGAATAALDRALAHHADGEVHAHAKHFRDSVLPAMTEVRNLGDKLETMVADDLWPLPTYREMLFIK